MPQDYNIYIHTDMSEGNKTSPFYPSSNKPTQPKTDEESSQIVNAIGTASNPDGIISRGIGAIAKAAPYVAVAIAVLKIYDQMATLYLNQTATETGNFAYITKYNNFKTNFSALFKPYSVAVTRFRYETETAVQNIRIRNNTLLLGDSVVNTRTTGRTV